MTSTPIGGYEPPEDHVELETRPLGESDDGTRPLAEPPTGSSTEEPTDGDAHVGHSAAHVTQSAKESGKQVASTAAEEASNVTAEARRQAKDLGHEVKNQAQQQAALQKDKAASGLHSLGEELRSMAQGGQSGPVTDLAHQAADKVTDLASWLERRDPGSLVEEVRTYARRKPGTFLLGAALAGVVAGRLTRGAVQASRDDTHEPTSHGSIWTNEPEDLRSDATEPGATWAAAEPTPIGDRTAAETTANDYETVGRPR